MNPQHAIITLIMGTLQKGSLTLKTNFPDFMLSIPSSTSNPRPSLLHPKLDAPEPGKSDGSAHRGCSLALDARRQLEGKRIAVKVSDVGFSALPSTEIDTPFLMYESARSSPTSLPRCRTDIHPSNRYGICPESPGKKISWLGCKLATTMQFGLSYKKPHPPV